MIIGTPYADTPTRLARPLPVYDLRFIGTVFVGVIAAGDLFVSEIILGMGAGHLKARHPISRFDCDAKAVDSVTNRQLESRVDAALFLITAHVQIVVIMAAISEAMNHPRIGVEIKDDWLIEGEQAVKVASR